MLRLLALAWFAAMALAAAAAPPSGRPVPDDQYLAAREAYAKGNATTLATLARALKGSIL